MLFESDEPPRAPLRERIEAALREAPGFEVFVLPLSTGELADLVSGNPFGEEAGGRDANLNN